MTPPYDKEGKPTFDTKGLDQQTIAMGAKLWSIIAKDGAPK